VSEEKTWLVGKVSSGVVALVLWVATAALGLFDIWVIHEMAQRVFARFSVNGSASEHDYWGGVVLGNWVVFILAVVWIGLVIGGGEYHYKYVGQPKSWRLFARTIAVELSILVLALFI
jgi:hypothetical protein